MGTLKDTLNEIKAKDDAKKAEIEKILQNQLDKKNKFKEDVKPVFDEIITPTLERLIKDFTDSGIKALKGSEVIRISYMSDVKQESISVTYKAHVMQFDIIGNNDLNVFEFKFNFKEVNKSSSISHPFNKSQNYNIMQVNAELIEKEIAENFKKIA